MADARVTVCYKQAMFPPEIHDLARKVIESYGAQQRTIAVVESCTGGLVGAALTQVPGASAVFERGFVTYSDDAKTELLGVRPETLKNYGAVSEPAAEEMAGGALKFSRAETSISVTGIAGPTGATPDKPVGLVCFGLARRAGTVFHVKCQFKGDRDDIRMQAVREALKLLFSAAGDEP